MSKIPNIDIFRRYLNNEGSLSDRKEMEDRLSSDDEFRRDFESFRLSTFILKREGFKNLVRENSKASNVSQGPLSRIWPIVLTISLLLLLLYFLSSNKKEPDAQTIYANYYEPFPDLISTRSSEKSAFTAMEAYNSQEYNRALLLLDTTIFKQRIIKLYRGIARLNTSQNPYQDFVAETQSIPFDDPLKQQLSWYRLMAVLKEGKTSQAIDIIKDISQSEFKYKEAQEILRLINH